MAKSAQINTFTNLRGVDAEVQKIQSEMSFSWLDNAFGMAEIVGKEGGLFPAFFNTNESDPQDLRPSDQYVDYCFWTYSSPGEVSYPDGMDRMMMRKGKTYATYPVSCIFYMKLPADTNYKVVKTQRRQEIWEFFDTLIGYGGIVAPTQIIDHSIREVFEGFELGPVPERWFYLPYYGIRFNMELTFRNYCV